MRLMHTCGFHFGSGLEVEFLRGADETLLAIGLVQIYARDHSHPDFVVTDSLNECNVPVVVPALLDADPLARSKLKVADSVILVDDGHFFSWHKDVLV